VLSAVAPAAITKFVIDTTGANTTTPAEFITEGDKLTFLVSITSATGTPTISNGVDAAQNITLTSGAVTNDPHTFNSVPIGARTYTVSASNGVPPATTESMVVTAFGAPAIPSFTGPTSVAFNSSGTLNFSFNCDGTGGAGNNCKSASIFDG